MGDLISRQDAIDVIMGEPTNAHYPLWYAQRIKLLPSAETPTVSEKHQLSKETSTNTPTDLISRADAIEAIVNTVSSVGLHDNSETARYGATYRQHEIIDILNALPSADIFKTEACLKCQQTTRMLVPPKTGEWVKVIPEPYREEGASK